MSSIALSNFAIIFMCDTDCNDVFHDILDVKILNLIRFWVQCWANL